MKHVTLIWPNMGYLQIGSHGKRFADKGSMEPLPLAALAALFPENYDLVLYDDRFEEIPYEAPTDLVCISIEIFTARRGYEIADEYRKRNIKVILGGMHASLMPDETLEHADVVIVADAELVWHQVLIDFENDKLQRIYQSGISNQLVGKFPRRELYRKYAYLPFMLLQFGRGCPYSCNFCAISACFKQRHITRNVQDVVNEILLDGRKLLFFVDDNIVANSKAAKELFKALIPLKIKWMGQASIDMAEDDELLELMSKSGCLGHVVGFESVAFDGLQQLNKQINLKNYDRYQSQINKLTKYGIQIWAAMVVGHDADTPESLREMLAFAKHHKFAFTAFNIIMPYPQTPFYDDLKSQGRLLFGENWWLHPNYQFNHAAFIPKNFTPEELTQVCQQLKNDYNSYLSIIQRVIKGLTSRKSFSFTLFLIKYGFLFRKEMRKKKYLKLGNSSK